MEVSSTPSEFLKDGLDGLNKGGFGYWEFSRPGEFDFIEEGDFLNLLYLFRGVAYIEGVADRLGSA